MDAQEPSPAPVIPIAADRFVEHRQLLTALARRLTKSASDADDLVQDTIERALRRGQDVPPAKLRSWMITVLNNLFIDQCRKSARRPQADSEVVASLPAPTQEPKAEWHKLDAAALRAAVDDLPKEFAAVYRLHAFEKKSYAEISAELGVPNATVGTRLLRARKKLKTILMKTLSKEAKS